jgi:hypothetical protein
MIEVVNCCGTCKYHYKNRTKLATCLKRGDITHVCQTCESYERNERVVKHLLVSIQDHKNKDVEFRGRVI